MSGRVPSWAVSSSSAAIFGDDAKPAPPLKQDAVQPEQVTNAAASANPVPRPRQKSVMRSEMPPSTPQLADSDGARAALLHLIALTASHAGFSGATSSALHEIEHLTERFITGIFAAAQYAAELGGRDTPSARDLLYALETHDLSVGELQHFCDRQPLHCAGSSRAAAKDAIPRISSTVRDGDGKQTHEAFLPSDSDRDSEEELWSVSSDSDGEFSNRRTAIEARVQKHRLNHAKRTVKRQKRQDRLAERQKQDPDSQLLVALQSGEQAWHRAADHVVPRHLPGMPPRHTWVHTAAYPTNAYSASDTGAGLAKNHPLVLVNRKLANARLVESSLRRLIQSTDSAAATAYSASRRVKAVDPEESSAKTALSPRSSSPLTAAVSSVAANTTNMPAPTAAGVRTPARSSLSLRLKNKMSNNSSTASSPTIASPVTQNMPSPAGVPPMLGRRPTLPSAFNTPLGPPGGLGGNTYFGSGIDPLMSPITPGPMTPSTTLGNPGAGISGGGSGGFNWTLPSGLRSRTNSVALPSTQTSKPVEMDFDQQDAELQLRIPGTVNYKNVWYAPGSTIQSGGLASAPSSHRAPDNTPSRRSTTVKRLRKWKV